MNPLIMLAIETLIRFLIGSGVFTKIEQACERWAIEQVSGAEKRHGVMSDLQILGVQASESAVRLGIQLVMAKWGKLDQEVKPGPAE